MNAPATFAFEDTELWLTLGRKKYEAVDGYGDSTTYP
jgi:hypothetical protein